MSWCSLWIKSTQRGHRDAESRDDDPEGSGDREGCRGEGLCSSVEMVLVVQTMSYINYELELSGPGLGHSDGLCDAVAMTFRVPRG